MPRAARTPSHRSARRARYRSGRPRARAAARQPLEVLGRRLDLGGLLVLDGVRERRVAAAVVVDLDLDLEQLVGPPAALFAVELRAISRLELVQHAPCLSARVCDDVGDAGAREDRAAHEREPIAAQAGRTEAPGAWTRAAHHLTRHVAAVGEVGVQRGHRRRLLQPIARARIPGVTLPAVRATGGAPWPARGRVTRRRARSLAA